MTSIVHSNIFSIKSDSEFERLALEVFQYQAAENKIYSEFLSILGINTNTVTTISNIPFLPVELFKSHAVICGNNTAEIVFSSSGTTGTTPSKHTVKDLSIYIHSFRKGFNYFYGDIEGYTILALLPSI